MRKPAETSVPVHELIGERWSPRALDPERAVTDEQLRALLEAARWAPSSGNAQPARFVVGRREDSVRGKTFDRILNTLVESNQNWAKRASVLLLGARLTHNDKGEIPHAEYALGLSAQNLALQAVAEGLVSHQMIGFDADAAHTEFGLPEDAVVRVAIAVGVQGEPELLGLQRRVDREREARERLPLEEFAFTDSWSNPAF